MFHLLSPLPLHSTIITYRIYAVTGSIPSDWTSGPSNEKTTPFAETVDHTLQLTAEIARNLVGAHQTAAALLVSGNWEHARKWFSLSSKYTNWDEYRAPAVGVGLHALVVNENRAITLDAFRTIYQDGRIGLVSE